MTSFKVFIKLYSPNRKRVLRFLATEHEESSCSFLFVSHETVPTLLSVPHTHIAKWRDWNISHVIRGVGQVTSYGAAFPGSVAPVQMIQIQLNNNHS